MQGEISYDLVMKENMQFVEGTFRLPGKEWQVLIVKKSPIHETEILSTTWSSGVTGFVATIPEAAQLSKQFVEQIMARWLGVEQWNEVQGPDSMQLR